MAPISKPSFLRVDCTKRASRADDTLNRRRLVTGVALAIAAILLGSTGSLFAQPGATTSGSEAVQAEVISEHTAPFTESWTQIARRNATMAAAARSVGVLRLRAAPNPKPARPERQRGTAQFTRSPLTLASPVTAPQTLGQSFVAISLQDQTTAFSRGSFPPDTMGAVGPVHFVEIVNGSVAIFDKNTGTRLSHVSLDSFFALPPFPRNGSFDPRVLFDRRSGRFFATAMEFGEPAFQGNGVILAVSRTSDPTAVWDKYFLNVGDATAGSASFFTDYSTLGVDGNGVYLGARIFPSQGGGYAKIIATPRASLLAPLPTLGTVYQFSPISDMYATPQPTLNFDVTAADTPHFFVGSSPTATENVHYRRLTWSSGVPALSPALVVSTPGYGAVISAPANGDPTPIDAGDDRLQMAIVRNNRLWTTRTVGVDATGSDGDVTRTGCEWLELAISSGTLALVQSGRVYDTAATDPRFYYYPSVVVSGQGHAALGFSGSRTTEFVSAFFTGRLGTDAAGATGTVTLLKAGSAAYRMIDSNDRNRWGDYSYTSVDPVDDMSIWTVQEYAASGTPFPSRIGNWGTWISKLVAPAPATPASATPASVATGQVSVNVVITGTSTAGSGFYDPGAGFSGRLAAAVDRGVKVNGVTYNSPTQVTLNLDTTAATVGSSAVTITNPDGQARTSGGILLVAAAPTPTPSPTATPTATPQPTATATPMPAATPTPSSTASPTPAPTPTPTPTPEPTVVPTPTPQPSSTPTPTASPTATPAATPTPTAAPERFRNIATRGRVKADDLVLIGGFIITGSEAKRVLVRAIGPSLQSGGVPVAGRLVDPVLDLYDGNGGLIVSNDNWKESQQDEIERTGASPRDDRESAIVRTLEAGTYTAVVRGANGDGGIALAEIYDLANSAAAQLANLSTRGLIETGDNVLIGGFIVGGGEVGTADVVLRAIGPSLRDSGVGDAISDPFLELRNAEGDSLAANNNWRDTQETDLQESGLAPTNSAEAAIRLSLPSGTYTAVVRGNEPARTGTGVVELYNLGR